MREKLLLKLAHLHANHPWRMLSFVVVLTVILGAFAGQITVTMDTKDLMPEGDPKVAQFNKLIDEFSSVTSIIVVAQGEEEKIKAFADDLAPRFNALIDTSSNTINVGKIEELKKEYVELTEDGGDQEEIDALSEEIEKLESRINFKLFKRVDYKAETEFLRNHALMMVKAEDLQNTKDLFMDPNLTGLLTNLNNSMEKEYVGQEESISNREKEDNAVNYLDGVQQLLTKLDKSIIGENLSEDEIMSAADEFLLGEPYFISYDKQALILNVIPNFSIMDRDLLIVGVEAAQELLDDVLKNHPGVSAGLSGDIAREHDEQKASEESLGFTSLIALVAILIMLIVSLRMITAPVLAIVNLIIGVLWAFGAAYIAVGQLNMMTAMLSIVLLGLGIDFSIHFISGLTEFRAAGEDILTAMKNTFLKSGKGIITGALTTACAFLSLLISESRGMSEMGLVTGLGLLSILMSTLLFLPVMMVFRERYKDRKYAKKGIEPKSVAKDIRFKALGNASVWLGKKYILTIILSVVISSFLIWQAFEIEYDRNMMSMEPKGLTSIALQDTISEKFDLSMEYALCLAESIEESRELAEKYREQSIVATTNDISVYLPTEEEQQNRIPHIRSVAEEMENVQINKEFYAEELEKFIAEIERLEMNIMEMQDMAFIGGQDKVDDKCKEIVGDPDNPDSPNMISTLLDNLQQDEERTLAGLTGFQKVFSPYFKENVLKMCSTEPISLEDIPLQVLDRFSNENRDLFMITIYPSAQLYTDTDVLYRFVETTERVSPKTTGGPSVGVAWMKISAKDGKNAVILTLIIVFILLWIDFKRPWYALMAMIPLGLGAFWMVGIMNLSGMMMSFMTLMGVPLIIGIGIDDGVHIMHRWRHEGKGQLFTVFSSTGKAVLLTSATTMLAFGSMVFSVFPAWAWFGASLFIGVGACFLTTVFILPGIMGFIERKKNK